MLTTLDKLEATIAQTDDFDLFAIDARQLTGELRDIVMTAQSFLGQAQIDPRNIVRAALPATKEEADAFVDKAIAFLVELRGDDLSPFNFAGHLSDHAA